MSYQVNAAESHGLDLPTPLREGIDPFISRTYNFLFAALATMAVTGLVSYWLVPRSWFGGIAIADCLLWIACGWFCWRQPIGFVFPVFSVVTGLFLGQLANFYADVFLSAAVMTLVAFGGLSFYVHLTRKDFSFMAGFLCLSFFIMLGGIVLSFLVDSTAFMIGLTGFGVLVFGCWILFDTSRIIHRADEELTPAVGAFELFLDIIGLFSWLLDLLHLFDSPGAGIDLDLDV